MIKNILYEITIILKLVPPEKRIYNSKTKFNQKMKLKKVTILLYLEYCGFVGGSLCGRFSFLLLLKSEK